MKLKITDNQNKYKQTFKQLNIIWDAIPKSDLVFCRDCLVHFSISDIRRAINTIVESGSKYLLATTFPKKHNSKIISTGQWTPYNFQKDPFNFPEPILLINENCQECFPSFNDKSLGLWKVSDLKNVDINN